MRKYFPVEKDLDGFNEFLPSDHIPVAGLPDAIRDQKSAWLNTISVRAVFSAEVEDGDLVVPVVRDETNDWYHPDTVWVPALGPDAVMHAENETGATYQPKFYGMAYKGINRVMLGPLVYHPTYKFRAGDILYATTNGKMTTEQTEVFVGACLAPGYVLLHGTAQNIDLFKRAAELTERAETAAATSAEMAEQVVEVGEAQIRRMEELADQLLILGVSYNKYAVADISVQTAEGTQIALPEYEGAQMSYIVGSNTLLLCYNGTWMLPGEQYTEVGTAGLPSAVIQLNQELRPGDKLGVLILSQYTKVLLSVDSGLGFKENGELYIAPVTATATEDTRTLPEWAAAIHALEQPVLAEGTTTARHLVARFADIVNVKDFGAVGDGETDDTAAWAAWRSALETRGLGYIPSGSYLVDGKVRHFVDGCIGNGIDWTLTGNPAPDDSFFVSPNTETGPILQHHREYNGIESWSPMLDLSFDSVSDREWPWDTNGAGAQGIQVRGTIKGVGNSHPTGVRSLMMSELNGDGDAVALWGRIYKNDPEGGVNNSDCCAIHAMAEDTSEGTGIVMASEHWARTKRTQGATGTNRSDYFDPGGIVCQHINASSDAGMAQAALLISGPGEKQYGAWHTISVHHDFWRFAGNNSYPEGTTFINLATIGTNHGPHEVFRLGHHLRHVAMVGGYDYNIVANYTRFANNTGNSVGISVDLQWQDGDTPETSNRQCGIALRERTYGGTAHVPGKGAMATTYLDIYHEANNANIFYRARSVPRSGHSFYTTDEENNLLSTFFISRRYISPGSDNTIPSGSSNLRWSQVYAATGAINTSDAREKTSVVDPDDALMRAWGKVNFRAFQFTDAVEKKGEEARIHFGVIAQQVQEAFASEGLDASRYALFCYDKWDAWEERTTITDKEAVLDEQGNEIEPAVTHEEVTYHPAGDRYGIRYAEALALECAYQRWMGEKREQRLAKLEALMGVTNG